MEDNVFVNQHHMEGSNLSPISALMAVARSVCTIYYYDENGDQVGGSGFFIKLETNDDNKPLRCLMSNEHVITKEIINLNKTIDVYYDDQRGKIKIKLDKNERMIRDFRYLGIDATIVEILEKDRVQNDLFLLPYIAFNEGYQELKDKDIYIVQYPAGRGLSYSEGKIFEIDEMTYQIMHKSSTKGGSSGSPICLKGSKHIIGIHKQGSKNFNCGNFIKPIVDSIKRGLNYGVTTYNDATYEGEYMDKISEGKGKITYKNKEYYIGNWRYYKKNGKGVLFYKDDKIKYTGDFVEDYYEGFGKYIESKGNYYVGNFLYGVKFGEGKEYKNDVLVYEGMFANDKYEGEGKYYLSNSNITYIGHFENGLMNGKGKIYKNGEFIFEGNFKDDRFAENSKISLFNGKYIFCQYNNEFKGTGKIFNKDGTLEYEGDIVKFQKHGKGILYMEDGIYKGEFKDNMKDGEGTIYDLNGNIIFEGNFKNNELQGEQNIQLKNGDKFEGQIINGKKEGYGIFTSKGSRYEGFYVDNKRNGYGKLYIDNEDLPFYEGNFVNDVFDGYGEIIVKDKAYYHGEFKNGVMHGKGKVIDKDNNVIYDGHFVDGEKEGESEMSVEGDSIYIGQMRKGKKNGHGILYNKNHEEIYNGEFVNDKKEGKGRYYIDKDLYYEGEFRNNKFNGEGFIYSIQRDRKLVEGHFVDDQINGEGFLFYENGDFEIAQFQNNNVVGDRTRYVKDVGVYNFLRKVEEKCFIF